MTNQKIETLLNLSLSVPDKLRQESLYLNAAVSQDMWEIIVRTVSPLPDLSAQNPQIQTVSLYGGYYIIRLPKELIYFVASLPQIIFIEMPKYITFQVQNNLESSCISKAASLLSLTGKGVLVGITDTGIDISHPDFLNEDKTSRIAYLWDQNSLSGPPPAGYYMGREYNNEEINKAISENRALSADTSGHGTAVAGIACGNGAASEGRFMGAAPKSDMIIVKMKNPSIINPSRTSELMQGINYCIQKSIELRKPIAINISFGNNYGSHSGTSLIETFLNEITSAARVSIIAASGNEGASPIHTEGRLSSQNTVIELSTGLRQPSLNLQIWKDFSDIISITIEGPSNTSRRLNLNIPFTLFSIDNTNLAVYCGEPSPYQRLEEICIEFIPESGFITSGIWKITLEPVSIKNGFYRMWLPSSSSLNSSTRFLRSLPESTYTIPSTSPGVITVGAYDSFSNQPADFSGRGSSISAPLLIKPDLMAPGVSIQAPASPATYQSFTGTSFAAPWVTGCAALLMEWGIVNNNDPFLYGEKIKAYLISSAKQFKGYANPNSRTGWGALCLYDIFDKIRLQ